MEEIPEVETQRNGGDCKSAAMLVAQGDCRQVSATLGSQHTQNRELVFTRYWLNMLFLAHHVRMLAGNVHIC